MSILTNGHVTKVLDLLNQISMLSSDLYGWFNYSGHTDQLDIDVHHFPRQEVPYLINNTYHNISQDPSTVASLIPELEAILEAEKVRIEKLAQYKKLKAELGMED